MYAYPYAGGQNGCDSSGVSYTMYKKYLVKNIFKKYLPLCQETFKKYLEDTRKDTIVNV